MTPTPDPARLHRLLVRYWDHTLTDAEAGELFAALAVNPAAQDLLRQFSLEAVAAADGSAVSMPALVEASPRRFTRRQAFGLVGLAAGAAAGVMVAARPWSAGGPSQVVLAQVLGQVRVGSDLVRAGFALAPGVTVAAEGTGSATVLAYPDGSRVALTGDSALTIGDTVRRLLLREGTATAGVSPQPAGAEPFVFSTSEVALGRPSGVVLSLGRGRRVKETAVSVHHGSVAAAGPSGESFGDVRGGEVLTVRADGARTIQPLSLAPDEFAWDLSRPLPAGWAVGRRDVGPEGPVVRPDFWFDPYHKAEMWQVRSDHQWAGGFFKVHSDSVVRVRYRVDRPGRGEVAICVRADQLPSADTGMMSHIADLTPPPPGEWGWFEATVEQMRANRHTPKFPGPWVGFLVILNTYTADLGLRVAEFRVARPGRPAAGV